MTKTIRFLKIAACPVSGRYTNVPGHTLAENQTVSLSDVFLDVVNYMTEVF